MSPVIPYFLCFQTKRSNLIKNSSSVCQFNFYLNSCLATVYEVKNGICVSLYIHCINSSKLIIAGITIYIIDLFKINNLKF